MTEQDRPPTEEELRAAYEAQLKEVRVDDVLIQTVVSLVNLAGRRAGLVPGAEDEADPAQLRQAIEAVRALLPLVEPALGPDAGAIRDALSRLQMEYARQTGPASPEPEPPAAAEQPGGEGPAQASGRLWVPGS